MRPRRGRDGWGGTREAIPEQVMKARNMGLIIDPMEKLLGVVGSKNKRILVLRTSQG